MGLSVDQRHDSVYSVLGFDEVESAAVAGGASAATLKQWRKDVAQGGMVIINSFQVIKVAKSIKKSVLLV